MISKPEVITIPDPLKRDIESQLGSATLRQQDDSLQSSRDILPNGLFYSGASAEEINHVLGELQYKTRTIGGDAPNRVILVSLEVQRGEQPGQLICVRSLYAGTFEEARSLLFKEVPSLQGQT